MMTREDAILGLRHWFEEYKAREKTGGLEPWDKHRMNMLLMAIEALENQETTKYKHLGTRHTHCSKPKGDSYDFAIIDEVVAYDTQKKD